MTQIIINLNNKEEETFVETFLKKMKISFEKNEDDFELTDEMKRVIDERKAKNYKEFTPAREFLKKVKEVGEGFVNFTKEITEKINNLSTKIDNEIKEIPNIVKKDTDAKLNEWKNDGTFENLIEQTYGSLNFLDNIFLIFY